MGKILNKTELKDMVKQLCGDDALRLLAEVLRDKRMWTEDFGWDFGMFHQVITNCYTAGCAIGLGYEIGMPIYNGKTNPMILSREYFGISDEVFKTLFVDGYAAQVSPTVVADRIDSYLSEKGEFT